MEPSALKRALQWFHALEVNQVALYRMQAQLSRNDIDKLMFSKAAKIEEAHVVNMHMALEDRGWKPSPFAVVATPTGMTTGAFTGLNLTMALKADIILENRAMEDYGRLIEQCNDESLNKVLWSNYLDESLHTEWFKSRLEHDIDKLPLV